MKIGMRLFQRKSGFWYVEFSGGRRRSLRTKDNSEAQVLYNAVKEAYLRDQTAQINADPRISWGSFMRYFLKTHTDIADDTHAAYDLAGRLFKDVVGASMSLHRISADSIEEFKKVCLARGVKKVSVNTYLRHLRAILNKAHEWGKLPAKVRVKMFKLPQRHPRTLAATEREEILEYTEQHNFELYRIITFALWTGCRRAEIQGLTWERVRDDWCTVIGKGDVERTVHLLPEALAFMGDGARRGRVFARWTLEL